MLNGQKRKTGDKSAWITAGLSSSSTWLCSVMVDLKLLPYSMAERMRAVGKIESYFNKRSRSVTDAAE